MLVEDLLPHDRVWVTAGEGLSSGQAAGLQADQAERHGAENQRRDHPDHPGPYRYRTASLRPEAAARRLGRTERRSYWPEDPPPEYHEQRWQQRDHCGQCDTYSDGEHGAHALGGVQFGDRQYEQADHYCARAGDDRRPCPAERYRHRLVPVLVAP